MSRNVLSLNSQIENGLSNRHIEDYIDAYIIKLQLKKLLIYFLPLY